MSDYSDLCEMYGISANDPEGFGKILDIWIGDELRPRNRNRVSAGRWIHAPLDRLGNLEEWKKKMEKYSSSKIGDVVDQREEDGKIIGYLCISDKDNKRNWLRVAWQENLDDDDFGDVL
jgi:hypothetical protein